MACEKKITNDDDHHQCESVNRCHNVVSKIYKIDETSLSFPTARLTFKFSDIIEDTVEYNIHKQLTFRTIGGDAVKWHHATENVASKVKSSFTPRFNFTRNVIIERGDLSRNIFKIKKITKVETDLEGNIVYLIKEKGWVCIYFDDSKSTEKFAKDAIRAVDNFHKMFIR